MFDEKTGLATIENTKVQIEKIEGYYNFIDNGKKIASLKDEVKIPLDKNLNHIELCSYNPKKEEEEEEEEEEKKTDDVNDIMQEFNSDVIIFD